MDADALTIRPLQSVAEYRACEELQQAVWNLDPREVVADHVLLVVQRHGGLALGAFEPGGRLVGTLFGFPGIDYNAPGAPWAHISHMMGVLPEWQGRGVGYRLKRAQREHALAQGLKLVIWTYDPLESRNAALNIGKLGAICRRYVRDMYGDMRDVVNAGLPSDRFEVEWWIATERVRQRLEGRRGREEALAAEDVQRANRVAWRDDGLPTPGETGFAWEGAPALVEIPAQFQQVRRADLELAGAWRLHTRALFEAAFAAGYAVVDFISRVEAGTRRSFYLLQAARNLASFLQCR